MFLVSLKTRLKHHNKQKCYYSCPSSNLANLDFSVPTDKPFPSTIDPTVQNLKRKPKYFVPRFFCQRSENLPIQSASSYTIGKMFEKEFLCSN